MSNFSTAAELELGRRIRMARKDKGLSQGQLADALRVSLGYISKIERGHAQLSRGLQADLFRLLELKEGVVPVVATKTDPVLLEPARVPAGIDGPWNNEHIANTDLLRAIIKAAMFDHGLTVEALTEQAGSQSINTSQRLLASNNMDWRPDELAAWCRVLRITPKSLPISDGDRALVDRHMAERYRMFAVPVYDPQTVAGKAFASLCADKGRWSLAVGTVYVPGRSKLRFATVAPVDRQPIRKGDFLLCDCSAELALGALAYLQSSDDGGITLAASATPGSWPVVGIIRSEINLRA